MRRRVISLLLFSGILTFLIVGISKLRIKEDLYAVFPDGKAYSAFSEVLQKNALNKQIIFSLDVSQNDDQTFSQLNEIVHDLERSFQSDISDIVIQRSVDERGLVSYLQNAAIAHLTPADYQKIDQKILPDSIPLALSKSNERLQGTNGFFIRNIIAKDPLGLLNRQLSLLSPVGDSSQYLIKDGYLYTRDESRILFFATLNFHLKDTRKLADFHSRMAAFKRSVNKERGHQTFDYFGTFQIAAENAEQVKNDTLLTTCISIGLILLVLMYFFRSILAPFYFLLPALFGMLCGGGLTGYFNPDISAISLATSSVLLGIVLDYSFHFFTHFKHSKDLIKTVREISAPMIIGSFTTIAALAALRYTDSVVLQDFGMIALFVLLGSVLFTIFFLPVIIHLLRIRLPEAQEGKGGNKRNVTLARISVSLIIVFTFIFLYRGLHVTFDADLNNLSYHSDELKQKEAFYSGIHPDKQKKLFIIAAAQTIEKAKEINFRIFSAMTANKEKFGISEIISSAPYLLPKDHVEKSLDAWQSYWLHKKDSIESQIKSWGKTHQLSESAFLPFYESMRNASIDQSYGVQLQTELGLNKLQSNLKGEATYITSIVIDRDQLNNCKQLLRSIEGASIFDIAELTDQMLNSVQADFNYLLVFSACLVFFTLLIIYGRLELALFAFFPMVLGWIWILGLSTIFDLKFNFVNIIVATFIFGLGDDFSIFTTDGLIERYKNGAVKLKSYRSAIILSGITTIVGTGALYFAKHPAIHSIAMISVVGITCILMITLFLQPQIFDFFITKRAQKGRVPITIFNFLFSIFLFTYFIVGSLILNLILIFIIIPLPLSKQKKRSLLNFLISKLAKSTLYLGFHVKKRIVHPEKLDFSKPAIIVANHSSFLDILLVIMLNPKVIIMVKSWVYNSPLFGLFIRYAGYLFVAEGIGSNLEQIKERIAEGYSIVVFPEGTRSEDGQIKRFHKGAFFISKELDLEIQPILLIGAHEVNPKNDLLIGKSELIVVPLDRVKAHSDESHTQYTKRVAGIMRMAYVSGKEKFAKLDFWQTILLKNYVFKGPIIEWYVRIKWMLEKKHIAFYDELLQGHKVIYDFGCGYGYLSYYLHYRNQDRIITAIDYDIDKISVAENCIKKNQNLTFIEADLRTFEFGNADAVFFNDVLHYLSKEDQREVLHSVAQKINEDGIIFIRDGVKEKNAKFKKTKLTEFLSTELFRFNKITNDLDFLVEEDIRDFAALHAFTIEKMEHSKSTSNVLFILRKKKNNG